MNVVLQSIGLLLYLLYRVVTFPFFLLAYSLWALYKVLQIMVAALQAGVHTIHNGIESLKPVLKNSLHLSRRLFHWFPNH